MAHLVMQQVGDGLAAASDLMLVAEHIEDPAHRLGQAR
jgi:hypothetical protein